MWTPTVKDIAQVVDQPDKLLTIKENATIAEAARKMSDHHVGCLIVFDTQGNFTGVLTERDMLEKVLTTFLSPNNLLVREVMTPAPISCTANTTLEKVEQLMAEHKIRHLPIIANNVPVGMVSSRDIIAYQLHSSKAMKAAAEQLALLSTEFKSLNLKDVIELTINEVPKNFGAERAVLCFLQKTPSDLIIYRSGCTLSKKNLLDTGKIKELSQNHRLIHGNICDQCIKAGGQAPRLAIPLNILDQPDNNVNKQGLLCMCHFNTAATNSAKLKLYKASLLHEILSVNLTNAKLYQDYQQARLDSETDPLTGVGTRRVLEKVLKAEHARAVRYNRPFSVAIVDLDNFKQINDTAGHTAGDKALQKLAEIMQHNTRETDIIIARYGGDEFVLLMPETAINQANILLERLRRCVETTSISNFDPMTVSCGLAEWAGPSDDTPEKILKRADAALYQAKRAGRNCTVTAQATTI